MNDKPLDRVSIVTDEWRSLIPLSVPNQFQLRLWLAAHGLSTVRYAIRECAVKYQKVGGRMDQTYCERFVSSICNRVTRSKGIAA
jgi:hypothetical protein